MEDYNLLGDDENDDDDDDDDEDSDNGRSRKRYLIAYVNYLRRLMSFFTVRVAATISAAGRAARAGRGERREAPTHSLD